MQDLTKLSVAELNTLDRDLELEFEHYDFMADTHGNDDGYYDHHFKAIRDERERIDEELQAREDDARIDRIADQMLYEMTNA